MVLAVLILSLPFAGAILIPFLPPLRRYAGWWAVAIALFCFVGSLTFLPSVSGGKAFYYALEWVPSWPKLGLKLSLFIDGLGLFFALLVSGIGLLILLYSNFYLAKGEKLGRFYAYMLFFMGSMLGTVLSSSLILLFVFWELMSFSSFLLIGFWDTREECRQAANQALIITVIGGLAMLAGFVLLYGITGTWELKEMLDKGGLVRGSPFYLTTLVLILVGAFSKSAQVPFHIWLPNAMVAPTPVSAFLHAATMVKAGVFLIARVFPLFSGTQEWFYLVAGVGLLTLVYGAYMAVRQHELKALLAYSTLSQIGLVIAALGFNATPGDGKMASLFVAAGIFHLLNHAVFKGALFLVVGAVEHSSGTRLARHLGGLGGRMPYTAAFAGITALSMAGVPLLSGFASKELFYQASLEAPVAGTLSFLLPTLAVGGSLLTFIYSLRVFHGVFLGPRTPIAEQAHEGSAGILLPIGILAGVTLLVGIYPPLVGSWLVGPAVASILQGGTSPDLLPWHGLNLPLLLSAITIALGLGFYWRSWGALKLQEEVTHRFSIGGLYSLFLKGLNDGTFTLYQRLQSGYLRYYLLGIGGFLTALVGYTLYRKVDFSLTGFNLPPLEAFEYLLAGLFILAALATVIAGERLAAVIALGVIGALVSLTFIIYSAPDLAMTQLLIEVVTVILFVLVFTRALSFTKARLSRPSSLRDILISLSMGGLVTILMLLAIGSPLFPSIRDYFVANTYARNIVNVIIVDFRGYDTMGEITVLTVAAIGLFCLIKLRKKAKE